jgi:acyl carrier protein
MGLDVVEIVLHCEEEFGVVLEDDRLEQMQTVGDLFELICEELKLLYGNDAPRPATRIFIPLASDPEQGWTRDAVWSRLAQVIVGQLRVAEEDVTYTARFGDDLGTD